MKKILFITGSRGEYGYIRPILREISANPIVDYEIVCTNMHLLPEFGLSYKKFEEDGFRLKYKILNTFSGYTPESMMKSLSVFGISLTDILQAEKPDLILLAGDRGEQFIGAMAGAHLGVPVAHIQAGELSGNVDGMTRHAIARYTHIHFAANEDAAARLVKSGEEPHRVHNVGAPQLDEFMQGHVSGEAEIRSKFKLEENEEFFLLVQHPVTEEHTKSYSQMSTTLEVLKTLGARVICIAPNSDAGSTGVQRAIEEYSSPAISIFRNVDRSDYAGLMATATLMIGNSSSGLLEAPTFSLPAINIGRRQHGRVQGENVINCSFDAEDIARAIKKAKDPKFKRSLNGMRNPYGDGNSSRKILEIILKVDANESLLNKQMTY